MKKLTTEVKDRVLVFFGKGYKIITMRQENAFLEESNTSARGIEIEGDYVNFSSVAKTISLDEFYNERPELRPHRPEMMNLFTTPNLEIRKYEKYDTHCIKLMREGVLHHIENPDRIPWKEWHGTGKRPAQDVLEKMDARIEQLDRDSTFEGKIEEINF